MTASKEPQGSSDDAIGRPAEWREGRYQQAGKPVDQTVEGGEQTHDQPTGVVSTPVTQRDYQSLQPVPQNDAAAKDAAAKDAATKEASSQPSQEAKAARSGP